MIFVRRALVRLSLVVLLTASSCATAAVSEPARVAKPRACKTYGPFASPTPGERYTGKLIDTHLHIPPPGRGLRPPVLNRDLTIDDIACVLKFEKTERALSFFPVFPDFPDKEFIDEARRSIRRHPTLFFPFIMPPGVHDRPPTVTGARLAQMLKLYPGMFKGYGEIGLYERDPGKDTPPDASIFNAIYPVVKANKLLVYMHPGNGHEDNFDRILRKHRNITFIVHGDGIERSIDWLMRRHPNVYFGVDQLYGDQWLLRRDGTKADFLSKVVDYDELLAKDVARWKALIESHPDRFLWGTDRGDAIWTFDADVGFRLADYGRAFIARLAPEVQEKFAYRNAQRLFDSAGI